MTLYLIAHKVRGEPAFDIACKMHITEDDWMWIIPTSGHRAYPYWSRELIEARHAGPLDLPADLPDHYPVSRREAADRQPEPPRSGRPQISPQISPPAPEDL